VLQRNKKPLSKIFGSCSFKIKKPNKYCFGTQTKFSIFLRNNHDCMVVDRYTAWKRYVCTRRKFPMYEKKIWIQQESLYKINFTATTKKWHNCTTVLYTKYVHITPKTISHQNQKTNTTPQLYGTLSTWVCKPKPISRQNQKLTWHNSTTGKKVPPAHAKQVYLFLCL
jgi:hypothetical protein